MQSSPSTERECKFYVRLDTDRVVNSLSSRDNTSSESKILSPNRISNLFSRTVKKKLNLLGDVLIDESGVKNDVRSSGQTSKHPLLVKHRQVLENVKATLSASKASNFQSISLEGNLPNRHLEALIEAASKINNHHNNTKFLQDIQNKLKWARSSLVADSFGNKPMSDALTLSKKHNNQVALSPWKTYSSSVRSYQSSTPFIPPTPISNKPQQPTLNSTPRVKEESAKKNLKEVLRLSSSAAATNSETNLADNDMNNPCLNFFEEAFEQETSNMLSVLDSILAEQDNTEVEEVLANWPLDDEMNTEPVVDDEMSVTQQKKIEFDEVTLDFMRSSSTKPEWTPTVSEEDDCLDSLTSLVIRIAHKLLELNNSSIKAKIDQVFELTNNGPEMMAYLTEINNQKKKIVEMLYELGEQKADSVVKSPLFIKARLNLEKKTTKSHRDELNMLMTSCYTELSEKSEEMIQLDKRSTIEQRVDQWNEFFVSYLNEFKLMFHDLLDEYFYDSSVKLLMALATNLETRLINGRACETETLQDPRSTHSAQMIPVELDMLDGKVNTKPVNNEKASKILKYKKLLTAAVSNVTANTERFDEEMSPESMRHTEEHTIECTDLTDLTKITPTLSTMAFLDENPDDCWLYASCSSSIRSSPPRTPVLKLDSQQSTTSPQVSIVNTSFDDLSRPISQEILSSPLSPPVAPPTPRLASLLFSKDSLERSALSLSTSSLNMSNSFHLVLEDDHDEDEPIDVTLCNDDLYDLMDSMITYVEKATEFLN